MLTANELLLLLSLLFMFFVASLVVYDMFLPGGIRFPEIKLSSALMQLRNYKTALSLFLRRQQ